MALDPQQRFRLWLIVVLGVAIVFVLVDVIVVPLPRWAMWVLVGGAMGSSLWVWLK